MRNLMQHGAQHVIEVVEARLVPRMPQTYLDALCAAAAAAVIQPLH